MKYKLIFILFLMSSFLSTDFLHAAGKHKNLAREKRKIEKIEKLVDKIPIYRGKLEGDYDILGPVYGQDIFSKSIKGIVKQIKISAYQANADAVIEFKCEDHVKKSFRNCQGFAIKFKKGPY